MSDFEAEVERLRAALDHVERLEAALDHAIGYGNAQRAIVLKLDAEVEKLREEMKHNDPASYSSMVYWREHCFKARAEVEKLREAQAALWDKLEKPLTMALERGGPNGTVSVSDLLAAVRSLRLDARFRVEEIKLASHRARAEKGGEGEKP